MIITTAKLWICAPVYWYTIYNVYYRKLRQTGPDRTRFFFTTQTNVQMRRLNWNKFQFAHSFFFVFFLSILYFCHLCIFDDLNSEVDPYELGCGKNDYYFLFRLALSSSSASNWQISCMFELYNKWISRWKNWHSNLGKVRGLRMFVATDNGHMQHSYTRLSSYVRRNEMDNLKRHIIIITTVLSPRCLFYIWLVCAKRVFFLRHWLTQTVVWLLSHFRFILQLAIIIFKLTSRTARKRNNGWPRNDIVGM